MGLVAGLRAAVLGDTGTLHPETGIPDAEAVADGGRKRGRIHILPSSRGKSIFAITCKEQDDAYKAAEYLVAGSAVFVNLQEVGRAEGQRIVDVLSGVAFGVGGVSQPTGDRIFFFVPHDFSLTLDDKSQLAQIGLFADSFNEPERPKPTLAEEPPPEMRSGLFSRAGFGPGGTE